MKIFSLWGVSGVTPVEWLGGHRNGMGVSFGVSGAHWRLVEAMFINVLLSRCWEWW